MYIHQLKNWPHFKWDNSNLTSLLAEVRHLQGSLLGKMSGLGFKLQNETSLKTLTEDVIKSSEIEGELLNEEQVRSSIAKKMGIDIGIVQKADRHIDGIVEIMFDATKNYYDSLTKNRLFAWHAALFPTGRSGMSEITVGSWRKKDSGIMQVVSGPIGKETVHFEAPTYDKLNKEMQHFIKWFNSTTKDDLVLKSSIAHLWFVTIHPFADGNGRIGRALTDMLLARSENSGKRFYSMSSQMQKDRKNYYLELEKSQKGSLDITEWIIWFLDCLKKAIKASEDALSSTLCKARFWKEHEEIMINKRQKKILNMLLDGFYGKLTSSKWAVICDCSQDTASRDINDLIEKKVLKIGESGGRSTHYLLTQKL